MTLANRKKDAILFEIGPHNGVEAPGAVRFRKPAMVGVALDSTIISRAAARLSVRRPGNSFPRRLHAVEAVKTNDSQAEPTSLMMPNLCESCMTGLPFAIHEQA